LPADPTGEVSARAIRCVSQVTCFEVDIFGQVKAQRASLDFVLWEANQYTTFPNRWDIQDQYMGMPDSKSLTLRAVIGKLSVYGTKWVANSEFFWDNAALQVAESYTRCACGFMNENIAVPLGYSPFRAE
jgi:hypothetical protein